MTTAIKPVAPYLSFSTFKNTVDGFRQNGLPSHVDPSTLQTMSGGAKSALIRAFDFLGLIDSDRRPTTSLQNLLKATPEQQTVMYRSLFENKYPEHIRQLLTNGTKKALVDALEASFEVNQDTTRKALGFLVGMAKEAGFSTSNYIGVKTRVRRPASRRPDKKAAIKHVDSIASPPLPSAQPDWTQGLAIKPILVGPRIWTIGIPSDGEYTLEEVTKFTEMIKLALT